MKKVVCSIALILMLSISGCSTETTNSTDEITSLKLEFDTVIHRADYYPVTNVLLVINEDTKRRIFVGRYNVPFQKIDPSYGWYDYVMDNSLENYYGWYGGGGYIISLVKEDNEYAIYEKVIGEGDNNLTQFKKVTSITINNPSVKLLDPVLNEAEMGTPLLPIDNTDNDDVAITDDNWLNHPKIAEIRAIYNDIEKSIKSGEFVVTNNNTTNELSYKKIITAYLDIKDHVIRKYTEQSGSDDSAYTVNYYYDNLNNLRFIFLKLGAVNGTQLEYRIYYDELENKIWEHETLLEGPGYPFNVDDYISKKTF